MKVFTKSLIFFSSGLLILTVLFRFSLSAMLQNQYFRSVWIIAALYGIMLFIIGWVFGKKDYQELPLYDIGFRFHFATYLICNLVAEIWYLLGYQSDYEKITVVHLTTLFWGIGIILHFIFFLITRKNAIKGMNKDDIFE